ncbi:uncharacterized protein LOC135695183 isoform X2 [Rhopilema esculentum]|uniref:uncharacterized protein LOC135695183 isoform X2 n=1 Tax=Rhopilema esculentum TaxID=499914 RepID=UPI0031DFAF4A
MEVTEENNKILMNHLSDIQNDLEKRSEVLKELGEYLTKLDNWMKLRTSTNAILKELPSTGKLLSQVYRVFKDYNEAGFLSGVLLDCITNFSNLLNSLRDDTSKHNKRVQCWAAELLQICTLSCISEDEARLMDLFGTSQDELVDAQIVEVASIINNLQPDEGLHLKLQDISQMLLPLIEEPKLKCIIESVVILHEKSLRVSRLDQIVGSATNEFFKKLASCRNLVKGFSDDSLVALWRCYLPAFEFEIIDLVKMAVCRPFNDSYSISKLLETEASLVCTCCNNYLEFYECTFDTLRQCLRKFGCYPTLVSLISTLHGMILMKLSQNDLLNNSFVSDVFLSLPPTIEGLSLDSKLNAVMFMSHELNRLEHCNLYDRSDTWFALVKYKYVVDSALTFTFHDSTSHIEHCIDLLCWFYFPTKPIAAKKTFQAVISNLKGLVSRNLLQVSDLSDVINSCTSNVADGINPIPLLRALVFQFLIRANASHCIMQESLSMVTEDLTNEEKLDSWLRSLEQYFMDGCNDGDKFKLANFRKVKKRAFILNLRVLLDQISPENFLSVNAKRTTASEEDQCQQECQQDLIKRTMKLIQIIEASH